jgi:hypothetical protein
MLAAKLHRMPVLQFDVTYFDSILPPSFERAPGGSVIALCSVNLGKPGKIV